MRRISILFILLGLSSSFTSTSFAQSREIGAQSLALDDGHGHIVDITIPLMTGPGPYSWVLPITPGGSALSLPTPTTVGSMLYSNGTNAWLENTNVTATEAGALTANSLSLIGGILSTPSVGAFPTALNISGGTGTNVGATINITAGNGDFGAGGGGNITIMPGTGFSGGNLQLFGGAGLGPTSGSISFFTSPAEVGVETLGMTLNSAGTFSVGSENQFQVDNLGNIVGASLNSTPIGNTSPNSGAFTYFSAIQGVPNGSTAQIYNTDATATTGQTGLTLGATGTGSLQNVGLQFNVSGAAANNNYDVLGSGGTPSWSVTSAGAATYTSLATNVASDATGTYFMGANDFTVIESGPSVAYVFLPPPTPGRIVAVRYNDATATDALVVWGPPASIDGAGEYDLNGSGGANPAGVTLVCDGTNWFAIGSSY